MIDYTGPNLIMLISKNKKSLYLLTVGYHSFVVQNRKKRFQRLPDISVAMSKRDQNCPVSYLKKRTNWK